MKKFINEFKEFALRGNMMDMAVGVIIGGAFAALVTSLTDNFINPILNAVTGSKTYTLQDIGSFGASFVSAVINFLIMAFVLFCLLKGINTLMSLGKKSAEEAPAAPAAKVCPYCLSEVPLKATKCAHCTSDLPAQEAAAEV